MRNSHIPPPISASNCCLSFHFKVSPTFFFWVSLPMYYYLNPSPDRWKRRRRIMIFCNNQTKLINIIIHLTYLIGVLMSENQIRHDSSSTLPLHCWGFCNCLWVQKNSFFVSGRYLCRWFFLRQFFAISLSS